MKYLVVTDTHLGHNKSNDVYLGVITDLFNEICRYATAEGISHFLHLGDFFDNRKTVSLKALHQAVEIGKQLQDTFERSYLIAGNHDLFYRDRYTPSSLTLFREFDRIDIILEPTVVGNIAMVPWIIGDTVLPDARFCAGHFAISGAKMNAAGTVFEGGMEFSAFKKYEKTLSGHFHTSGIYPNNILYLGAPYHMDFNDVGRRGFHVFDDEGGGLTFVPFEKYPHYIKWEADKVNIPNDIKGNVVKIIFNEDFGTTENSDIIRRVTEQEPYQLFTEYRFTKGMTKSNISEDVALSGPKDVHLDFIRKSSLPDHLKQTVMEKMLEGMYEELAK